MSLVSRDKQLRPSENAVELESAEAFLETMDEIDLAPYPPKAA
jgi:hypothetical protein